MTGFGNKNHVSLIGRLGRNPEITVHSSGSVMAKFQLATERSFKKKGSDSWEKKTSWHNVVAWGRGAEFVKKYFRKGRRVGVDGFIDYFDYEKNGETRYGTQIVAQDLQVLDQVEHTVQQPAGEPSLADLPPVESYEDDVPF